MAMTACKECGKEISDQAKSCPSCGAPAPKDGMGLFGKAALSLGGVLLLFIVIGAATGPSNDPKAKDRNAIAYCWERQSSKTLDPAAARFAAGACEKMEADFKDRYGFKP